jgi:hypothetical protein
MGFAGSWICILACYLLSFYYIFLKKVVKKLLYQWDSHTCQFHFHFYIIEFIFVLYN